MQAFFSLVDMPFSGPVALQVLLMAFAALVRMSSGWFLCGQQRWSREISKCSFLTVGRCHLSQRGRRETGRGAPPPSTAAGPTVPC